MAKSTTAYLVMITATTSFSWYGHLHFLLQNRPELSNEANMRDSFLHDNGHGFGSPAPSFINCLPEHFNSNAVPSHTLATRTHILLEGKVAIQFQVQSVVLADLGMLGFVHDLPRYVQLGTLGIEVQPPHSNLEPHVDARGAGGAGFLG